MCVYVCGVINVEAKFVCGLSFQLNYVCIDFGIVTIILISIFKFVFLSLL